MKFSKLLIFKIFFIFVISPLFFKVPKANAAEEIKITYSIFSRTIKVNSLKTFAKEGKSTRQLKRILKASQTICLVLCINSLSDFPHIMHL